MKNSMLVTELQNRLHRAENDIEDIIAKLIFEGILVRGIDFTPYGRKLDSHPTGYGIFVPKISITIVL